MEQISYEKIRLRQFAGRHVFFFLTSILFFWGATRIGFLGSQYVNFMKEVIGNFYSSGAIATWCLMGLLYLPAISTACALRPWDNWFTGFVIAVAQWLENAVIETIAIITGLGLVVAAPKALGHAIVFFLVTLLLMFYAFIVGSGWIFNGSKKHGWISGYVVSLLSIIVVAGGTYWGEKKVEAVIDYAGYVAWSMLAVGVICALWRKYRGRGKK